VKQSTGLSTGFPLSRTLAIANQKGGVGKTTTAISVAAALAVLEKKVLLIDFDPQGNTTGGLGVDKASLGKTVYEWMLGEASFEETARATDLKLLTLIPASRDLVGAEVELVSAERREFRLSEQLDKVRETFDYVLIDCPPSLGFLTLNALTAVDAVLIPIQCEYFALEGVTDLMETIERVKITLNPMLEIGGVLLTMYDERTNLSRQVADDIRAHFGKKVFRTVIPRSIRLAEAPSFGKPIMAYDIKSKGAEAYLGLAAEILARR